MKACSICKQVSCESNFYKGDPYCKPCRKAKSAANYLANQELRKAQHNKYTLLNSEAKRKVASEWAKNNRAKRSEIWANYYAAKLRALPGWADRDEIKKVYELAKDMTIRTGIKHHVDHIIPLQGEAVSGLHVPNNLQVITALENAIKSNKYQA